MVVHGNRYGFLRGGIFFLVLASVWQCLVLLSSFFQRVMPDMHGIVGKLQVERLISFNLLLHELDAFFSQREYSLRVFFGERCFSVISKVTRPIAIRPICHIVTRVCGFDAFVVPLAKMCRSIGGVCFLQCLRNCRFPHVLFFRFNRRQHGVAKPAGCHSMQQAVA